MLQFPHVTNYSEKQISVMTFFENLSIARGNADAPLKSSNASLLGERQNSPFLINVVMAEGFPMPQNNDERKGSDIAFLKNLPKAEA